MKKHIFVRVDCANQFDFDVPTVMTVEIDSALQGRIKFLAEKCKELNVQSLKENEFYSQTVWAEADFEFIQDLVGDVANYTTYIASMNASSSRIEIPMLIVYADGFRFTCVPKHCGDDMRLTTRKISLEVLNRDSECTLIDLP